MTGPLHALFAFVRTLWVCRAGRSRMSFQRWQARRLQHWLRHDLRRVAAYAGAETRLDRLPVTDKAAVMARFAAFNRDGITAGAGWAAVAGTGSIGGITIGTSTGTSGNRSLYAITGAERYRWLGTILAKTIPGFLFRPERVAILLPQSSALYDGARRMPGLDLAFFDLRDGPEAWLDPLQDFAPTTLVAPPRVLRHLAEYAHRLTPRRLYAGAETLDPVDRRIIETRFGLALGQIYMASEGLFAVTCRHNRLHLAEDANVFEFEPVGGGLVTPVVTSFGRSFQIMARYRMNDLLRLSDVPCPCGSPLRVVDEVVGRMDDVFEFARPGAPPILITPDVLRNAVLDAAREITDFRILRDGQGAVTLTLPADLSPASAKAALSALQTVFTQRGLHPDIRLVQQPIPYPAGAKLRRVENRFHPQDPA